MFHPVCCGCHPRTYRARARHLGSHRCRRRRRVCLGKDPAALVRRFESSLLDCRQGIGSAAAVALLDMRDHCKRIRLLEVVGSMCRLGNLLGRRRVHSAVVEKAGSRLEVDCTGQVRGSPDRTARRSFACLAHALQY